MKRPSLVLEDRPPVVFEVEALESRQLLAATAAALAAEPAAPFIARVNFQPAGAAVPAGYFVDIGAGYGPRGNGLTYGWNVSNNNKTRDRNNTRSPDQRFDTLNHMSASQTWQIAVPNGRYAMKLVSGDAAHFDSYFRIDAEGERIIDYQPTTSQRWANGLITVDVADGALTLRSAAGASNNKVCFIEIYQSDLPTTVSVGPENVRGFTRSGPADFLLRPSGSTLGVAKVEFFSNGVKIGEDTAAPFGLLYRNVDPGKYAITTTLTYTSGTVTRSTAVPLTVKEGLVAWMTIGASDTNIANRRVGWGIKQTGWQGFVNNAIKPQISWGATRVLIHNPFGTLPDEQMQLDQYLHAKAAGLTWLTNGFVEAWRPITQSGVEVICYLGRLEGDPDFTGANWQQRFWDSVAPAINSGMSIALDAAVLSAAGSKTHQAAQMLRNLGVEVYVEARPLVAQPHWLDYNVISTDTFWDRTDPDRYADAKWGAPASMIRGEIIRAVTQPPFGKNWTDQSWLAPYTRDIMQDGHTAAVAVYELDRRSVTKASLFV